MARAVLIAIALVCGVAAATQQPARDSARPAATASISGRVFAGTDGKQPARRARVTLTSLEHGSPDQTTTTDDNGAFSFRGLAAGRFEIQAFKNAYLRASYGASRPDRPGTPVVVKDGDAIANLAITIVRGGVITGVVRDVKGRPAPGVSVRVLRLGYNPVTGERTLSAPAASGVATSDDRGEYRAYGLPPGGYLVLVTPASDGGRGDIPIRVLSADDVRKGSLSPSSARVDYAPVFHPSATDMRAAATVALGVSEERTGIDITIQLVPTATISGTITSSTGPLPAMVSVGLVRAGVDTQVVGAPGFRDRNAELGRDGRFILRGVAPGTYRLKALIGRGRGAVPNQPTQWAAADVTVSGEDLDIPLTLQPGIAINGRAVFEGAQPTAAQLQALSIALIAPGTGGVAQGGGGGRVDGNGRFTFAGVAPDAYQFTTTWTSPAAADRWALKSSTANGGDAYEAPLRVNPGGPLEWTLTFTDTPTTLAGVLQDDSGRAATDYYVLLYSPDRRFWVPGSRRVRMTRPATDGSYRVRGIPPGEYLLATPADLEPGEWNDPALLERLIPSAARITLREGETTTRNFRIQ